MRAFFPSLLLGLVALVGQQLHAQVNGNATITGSAFGQALSVSTSSQFAGSISSIKLGNREFINNWDHGRQLQGNFQFFNRFECYNPYEAGSFLDGTKSTTTSLLLSLTTSGNKLESNVQMAWYMPYHESYDPNDYCGDPSQWISPVPPYTGPVSSYEMHKTVTIGYAGLPNVIEHLSDLYVPERIQKGINNITAVLPYDFSSVYSYDVVAKEYRNIRLLSGEDDRIKVAATPDGSYAMAFYSPELLGPYGDPSGYANWWRSIPPDPFYRDPKDPNKLDYDFACMHIGSINRYDTFNGPGSTHDRSYIVIGSLEQVRTTLVSLHNNFRALDPEVFNWKDYIKINHLEPYFSDAQSAEQHWLAHGISEGRPGSKTFSPAQYLQLNPDVANFFGNTNYQGAIDHFASSGRYEGRTTVAKASPGAQHMLVAAERNITGAGQNGAGQLTSDDSAPALAPKQVAGLSSVTETAAGDYTSFAVRSDGTLWMWGSNRYGARGDGSSGDNVTAPVQVPIPFKISTPSRAGKHAVAVGAGVCAAIDTTGQVWTWGMNWNGRLGDGTKTPHFTPARVRRSANGEYFTGAISVSAAGGTIAAVDADETVWTWGAGSNGELGNGVAKDSSYPVQVVLADGRPLAGITEVACGSSGFCVALARYGAVYGWGNNNFAQLGMAPGGNLAVATIMPVSYGHSLQRIAAGAAHVIALDSNGVVYGWGYNGRGQLGIGTESAAQVKPVPMQAGPQSMKDIDDLAAGANFSVMIRNSDRAVFVVGDNQSGQLGISNQSVQVVPVRYGQAVPVVAPKLLNISTRTTVQTGDNVLIGGFIISGTMAKKVVLRATGPSLAAANIKGALADPTLELHDQSGALVAANDNWKDSQEADIRATGLQPTSDLESVIIRTLDPGLYTAVIGGKNNATGIAVVEVYDLDSSSDSKLANISTRGLVQTGDNVLIGGVIAGGDYGTSTRVVLRAVGPSLPNVANALADPTLELHDSNGGIVAANDNWKDTQQSEITALGVAPSNDAESAILTSLTPGFYTAIIRGKNDTSGNALIEAYDLGP